jgi:small subunit ribosomal protein S21
VSDSGIPGSAQDGRDRTVTNQRPNQGMLTAAAANDEDFHGNAIDRRRALRLESAFTRDSLICSSDSAGPVRAVGRGRKGGVSGLAEVKVQEGESIESALRRFKRKVQQEDIIKDIKKHSYYLKPGDRRRAKQALARKRTRKKQRRESD